MAVDLALAIRVGSAALWMALGAFILIVGRRRGGAAMLGAFALAFGAQFAATNVALAFPTADVAWVFWLSSLATAAAGLLALALAWRALESSRARVLVIGGGATLATWTASLSAPESYAAAMRAAGLAGPVAELQLAGIRVFSASSMCMVALLAALAVRARSSEGAEARSAEAPALAIGLWLGYNTALDTALDTESLEAYSALRLSAFCVAASLWVFGGSRERWVGWGLLASALAGAIGTTWFGESVFGSVGVGVLRTVGVAILARAVFKDALLGVPLPRLAEHRGAAAATALALLFIVAQVAQNFFSAEYGLLTGGIVAGAFLFAAQPIQRAFERSSSRTITPTTRTHDRASGLYRATVRRYLRDGTITRDEERHLAHLAGELGLDAGHAFEMREEIEREVNDRGA